MKELVFKNRVHAGQLLARPLMKYADRDDVMILGLPRGGVPVASQVAHELQAPLDVITVRKLAVPGHEELAMGALASGGGRVIHEAVVRAMGISEGALDLTIAAQLDELQRRELAYRGLVGAPVIEGRTVILIDDGMATGSTFRAALQSIRRQQPARVIIAVPTAALGACAPLVPEVDEFIALMVPDDFRSVGQWYEDFRPVSDAEVTRLLDRASRTKLPQQPL